ncbi:hypothetical protein B0J12DRAFT_368703 [Macrophomina phaseolina]|uniref:Secreted protein n=1 Tax=Macrophomina phaseolina TaxID=35725 RepID=A0ABQ8GJU3_9PEZI|nr:hypothetical protein B0J12DRAFT_368703 [Macrophomina phaseolina]
MSLAHVRPPRLFRSRVLLPLLALTEAWRAFSNISQETWIGEQAPFCGILLEIHPTRQSTGRVTLSGELCSWHRNLRALDVHPRPKIYRRLRSNATPTWRRKICC